MIGSSSYAQLGVGVTGYFLGRAGRGD